MNREIKFRGKTVDDGEWVYGYLIENDVIVGEIVDLDSEGFITQFWCTVDPETVGQYAEIKDINGKEVYDGDIVFLHNKIETNKGHVSKVEVSARYGAMVDSFPVYKGALELPKRSLCDFCAHDKSEENEKICKVIGNIYDHPYLLEGKYEDE